MTTAALSPSRTYIEDGVTLNFAVPFRYLTAGDLAVERISAAGVVTRLVLNVGYTATSGATDAGGTLTLLTTVAGAKLRIRRATARNQSTDYATNDTFPAESHEAALDRAMLIDQEQDVQIADTQARALLVPDGETVRNLPAKADRIGKYSAWDANGDPIGSTGTGADAGLRADLAAQSGTALIGLDGLSLKNVLDGKTRRIAPGAPALLLKNDLSESVTTKINTHLAADRRLHIGGANGVQGRFGVDALGIQVVQDGTCITFDPDARLEPIGAGATYCIRAQGAPPAALDFIALSDDAYAGSIDFLTATAPSWVVDDWIELRSENLLPNVPNLTADASVGGLIPYPNDNRIGQLVRVIYVGAFAGKFVTIIDRPLDYDFATAWFAKAGKATVIRDLVIDGANLNHPGTALNLGFGIFLSYCVNFRLINIQGFRSKDPLAGVLDSSRDFIKYTTCVDGSANEVSMAHGGYYGHSILGACDNLKINGGTMCDVRHAVSLVHVDPAFSVNPYGQPLRTSITDVTAINTSLSSFDEHYTGRWTVYTRCRALGSGDDGYQTRTVGTVYRDCIAQHCNFDGFSQSHQANRRADVSGTKAYGCLSRFNGRFGVDWSYGYARWNGGEISGNCTDRSRAPVSIVDYSYTPSGTPGQSGTAKGGGTGIRMHSGAIENADITLNGGSVPTGIFYGSTTNFTTVAGPLQVSNNYIPGDATRQFYLMFAATGALFSDVDFNNNRIPGYTGAANRLWRTTGGATGNAPRSEGNKTSDTGTDEQGVAVLVAGTVTVANTNFRSNAGGANNEPERHKIKLTLLTEGGTPGAVRVLGGTGNFTLKSTSALDTSTYRYERHL